MRWLKKIAKKIFLKYRAKWELPKKIVVKIITRIKKNIGECIWHYGKQNSKTLTNRIYIKINIYININ